MNEQLGENHHETSRISVGSLIPIEYLKQIEAAISMVPDLDEADRKQYLRGIDRMTPALLRYDHLLQDASATLSGDGKARLRFTNALLLEKISTSQTSPEEGYSPDFDKLNIPEKTIDPEVYELWREAIDLAIKRLPETQTEPLIPQEHVALAALAATYAGLAEPRGTHRYLRLLAGVFNQAGGLEWIWLAAQNALTGDERNLRFFGEIMRQIKQDFERYPDRVSAGLGINMPHLDWPPTMDLSALGIIPGSELRRQVLDRYGCMIDIFQAMHGLKQPMDGYIPVTPYTITSITPKSACQGSRITINGSGFGNTPNTVSFPGGFIGIETTPFRWNDTMILVDVPPGATCGDIRLNIPAGTVTTCGQTNQIYKPGTGSTFFEGSTPDILSFTANGKTGTAQQPLRVEPGTTVTLAWKVCQGPNTSVRLQILDSDNRHLLSTLVNVSTTGTYSMMIPLQYNTIVSLECVLTINNACVAEPIAGRIFIQITKTPNLKIEGVEVTQGIQTFWRPGVTWNSLETVAGKDTIVRVYVSADMGGFNNDEVKRVTGTLTIGGLTLYPINGITPTNPSGGDPFITARRVTAIQRASVNHTLNFRIPAAQAVGTQNLFIYLFAMPGDGSLYRLGYSISWTWQNRDPFPVRWIRIIDNDPASPDLGSLPTDAEAQYTVQRAFDLFPRPATDIAPLAYCPIRPTGVDYTTDTGGVALLRDLQTLRSNADYLANRNKDYASLSYRWIGLTVRSFRGWGDGTVCIAPMYLMTGAARRSGGSGNERTRAAHELAHSMGLGHPATEADDVELGDVAFDPYWNKTISENGHDLMSYNGSKGLWIKAGHWNTLRTVT